MHSNSSYVGRLLLIIASFSNLVKSGIAILNPGREKISKLKLQDAVVDATADFLRLLPNARALGERSRAMGVGPNMT